MTTEKPTSVIVTNIEDDDFEAEYVMLTPREAVMAAYAQFAKNDWNTWDYEEKYGHMPILVEGKYFYWCGDYCAKKVEEPM